MKLSHLAILAGVAILSNNVSVAQSCGTDCPLHTEAFADEFHESAVNENVWNYRTDKKALSAQLASNVDVTDGYMRIELKKETVGSYAYTGGGLVSKQNFHYGFYEARMKLNHGAGWHSSFWQMAGNGSTTASTASPNWTEIDTFEVDSNDPWSIRHNIYAWYTAADGTDSHTSLTSGIHKAAVDYSADYHIFGTLWDETSVSFYTDGVVVKAFDYPAKQYPHDYLNIWLTCIGYTSPITDSALPSYVSTDYVRFYQRDYYLTATSLCRGKYQGSAPCPSNEGYKETGTWAQSSLDGYTLALKSRYSCNVAGNSASWTQKIPTAGTYHVAAWVVAYAGSDQAAVFTLVRNGAMVKATTVDQSSGTSAWVTIVDQITVEANDTLEVTLKASGTGCTRSDTVKLVRIS